MVDVAWLSRVLRDGGVLVDGEVVSVAPRATSAFNSATVFADVVYRGAGAGLPTRLVVKRPAGDDWSRAAARVEAGFYRYVATLPDHPRVVPACLAAGDDFLVLADLSATHAAPVRRDALIGLQGLPAPDALDAAVDTLARLHAYWWRRDAGPLAVATWWGEQHRFDAYAQRRRQAWQTVAGEVPGRAREVTSSSSTTSSCSIGGCCSHAGMGRSRWCMATPT